MGCWHGAGRGRMFCRILGIYETQIIPSAKDGKERDYEFNENSQRFVHPRIVYTIFKHTGWHGL